MIKALILILLFIGILSTITSCCTFLSGDWYNDSFSCQAAYDWKNAGFTLEETEYWVNLAKVNNPKEAQKWKDAGFTPTETARWKECAKLDCGFTFTLGDALKWRNAGFTADEAEDWLMQ